MDKKENDNKKVYLYLFTSYLTSPHLYKTWIGLNGCTVIMYFEGSRVLLIALNYVTKQVTSVLQSG